MPPRNSEPLFTLPDYKNQFTAQTKKWDDLIKSDPRRVCRALLITTPRGETVEGDNFDDLPILFHELKNVSSKSTAKPWKALVDAGIIAVLCKCALTFEGSVSLTYVTLDEEGTARVSQKAMDWAQTNAPAPYSTPLEIICNAAASCAVPPTATEQKMIEELKKNWSTIMQRIWSEPHKTLEPGTPDWRYRIRERVVVAQLVHRLAFVDPSFLEVILKPSDLTLAVCFRYWLYSTDDYDTMINSTLISPLLDDRVRARHWARYFEEHPLPEVRALLPRILLGASRGTEKKKRTPNQAAEFIVSTFARHIQRLKHSDRDLNELFTLFAGLLTAAKTEYPAFCRAVYKSESFWTAVSKAVIQQANLGPIAPRQGLIPETMAVGAVRLYFNVLHTPEGPENIDTLVYNWISGGLFDALDAAIPLIIRSVRGPMLISGLLSTLDSNLPKLSAKTRSKLRSELPRPRLLLVLILLATRGREEVELLLAIITDSEKFMRSPVPTHDPRHPVWSITAWQLLLRITNSMRPLRGTCTRRGCEKPAYAGGCGRCKISAYCGQECMSLDKEHKLICKWVPTLMIVDLYQRRNREEVAELLGDGVAPEPPSDLMPPEERLKKLRESGEMTEDEIEQLMAMQREAHANASTASDPIPGVTDLEKAMEKLRASASEDV
ncbi:hypothetical protein BV20DRAFT_1043932 [Pilatotrama ljubarskyi]|nr:hypothetical protein BV20DRAFT_1043932 [Pilatotrama ljubarskyi]